MDPAELQSDPVKPQMWLAHKSDPVETGPSPVSQFDLV